MDAAGGPEAYATGFSQELAEIEAKAHKKRRRRTEQKPRTATIPELKPSAERGFAAKVEEEAKEQEGSSPLAQAELFGGAPPVEEVHAARMAEERKLGDRPLTQRELFCPPE